MNSDMVAVSVAAHRHTQTAALALIIHVLAKPHEHMQIFSMNTLKMNCAVLLCQHLAMYRTRFLLSRHIKG